jgi:hypothetical protein
VTVAVLPAPAPLLGVTENVVVAVMFVLCEDVEVIGVTVPPVHE